MKSRVLKWLPDKGVLSVNNTIEQKGYCKGQTKKNREQIKQLFHGQEGYQQKANGQNQLMILCCKYRREQENWIELN